MKKLYWRPRAVSRTVLLIICFISLGGLFAVRSFRIETVQPYFEEKRRAARLAREAMDAIKSEREIRDYTIDPLLDPAQSGMIGETMTPVTSVSGFLPAKQTTANPNWAAVFVDMLKKANVQEGDVVAVGCSGSFPALNVCVYAALETLKIKPIVITSVASSQWGANIPDLMWLDMERILREDGLISFKSSGASIGGFEDRGTGMSDEGRKLIEEAIRRNNVVLLDAKTFTEGVDERMRIYREEAGDKPVKAYINVGGGTLSVGKTAGKRLYHPGLNLRVPRRALTIDSVMARFVREGAPAIHLVQVQNLANRYGLPNQLTYMPNIGEGDTYRRRDYNPFLAGGVLAVIFGCLYVFLLSDWGFRIIQTSKRSKSAGAPEPMI